MSPSKTACIVLFLVGVSIIQCHATVGDEAECKTNRVLEGAADEYTNQINVVVTGLTKRISSFITTMEYYIKVSDVEEKIEAYKKDIAERREQLEQRGKNVTECVENLESKFDKVLEDLYANEHICAILKDMETSINQAKSELPQVKETSGEALITLGINSFVGIGTQLTGAITKCINDLLEIVMQIRYKNHNNEASNKASDIYFAADHCIRNKL